MTDPAALRRSLLGCFLVGLALSITLAEAALALLGVLWLARVARARVTPERLPLLSPVLALAAATILSALLSATPGSSLVAAKSLLLVAAFYVVLDALPDTGAAEGFLTGLSLLLAGTAALGAVQVLWCPPDPGLPLVGRFFRRCDRAHAFYSIYMTLAGVLTLSLLATLPRLFARSWVMRPWLLPAWAVTGLGLVLTFTRGAWLGVAAGAAALALLVRRGTVLLAVAGLFLLALLVLLPTGTLGDRLRAAEDPATLRERLYMWQSGLAMVRDHPLTGVGAGQVKAVYPRYARPEAIKRNLSHLHSTPLQVAAERGLLGLAAWLWLWSAFFVRGIRLYGRLGPDQAPGRRVVAGSLAAVTGFLAAGLFENNFGDSEVAMVAYVVMALPFVVEKGLSSSGGLRSPA